MWWAIQWEVLLEMKRGSEQASKLVLKQALTVDCQRWALHLKVPQRDFQGSHSGFRKELQQESSWDWPQDRPMDYLDLQRELLRDLRLGWHLVLQLEWCWDQQWWENLV